MLTEGEETDEMREASYKIMNTAAKNRPIPKPKPNEKKYNYKGAASGVAASTGLSSAGAKTIGIKTVTTITNVSRSVVTPIKLSAYPQVGNFFTAFALVSLTYSVRDNFSGEYSTGEAWARTAFDVSSTAAIIVFCASGGWAAVGIGLGIGVIAEGGKGLVNLYFNRKRS